MAIPHLFMESPRPKESNSTPRPPLSNLKMLFRNSILVLGVLAVALIVISFLLPTFVKPAVLEKFLTSAIDKHTNYSLSVEKPGFSILPTPSFRFLNVKIWSKTASSKAPPLMTAEHISCQLNWLPLIFKKIEFSNVKLSGTYLDLREITGAPVRLTDVDLTLENVGSGRWIKASGSGAIFGTQKNFKISGKVKSDFNNPNLRHMLFSWNAELRDVDLAELAKSFSQDLAAQIKSGKATVNLELIKKDETPSVYVQGTTRLNQIIFQAFGDQSADRQAASYDVKLEANYDVDMKALMMKSIDIGFPFAQLHGKGAIDFASRRFEDVQLTTAQISLDQLSQHLPIAKYLPLHLGFSGESQADFKLNGVWDEIFIDAKLDFTKALLTYSKYFSKPKGVPLVVTSEELVVKRQKEIDGGINIQFKDVKLKGSLVKFDASSKVGEVTFVTNLIPLEGWEEYFPTFAGYQFSGTAKFFGNGKGDFQNPGRMITMSHVAFNDVGVRSKEGGVLIEKLNGNIDMGPIDFESKNLSFDFGKSHFDADIKMFFTKPDQVRVELKSPEVDVRNLTLHLRKVSQVLGVPAETINWNQIEKSVSDLVPSETTLNNLLGRVTYQDSKLVLQNLDFDVFSGHVSLIGVLDGIGQKQDPNFQFHTELQNLSLARMSRRDLRAPVEGNIFLLLDADGEGFSQEALRSKLKGEGAVTVTNGEFHTFDVLGSLGAIAQFAGLGNYVSGTTRFNDVNGKFQIANGKIGTDHVLMVSNDFNIDASGDIGLDGNLNFRLDTVLSNELSRKIDSKLGPEDRLGPIPLLLTGKIESPTLRPDPSLVKDFIGSLLSNKFGDVIAGKGWLKSFSQKQSNALPVSDAATSQESNRPQDQLAQTGLTLLESLFQKKE